MSRPAMRINDAGFRRDHIGVPDSHALLFQRVATNTGCVILSRAVGPTCLQLLEQGYDTKGFRVHAKSCTWGPMAGFVLRDPRLNKAGVDKIEFNPTDTLPNRLGSEYADRVPTFASSAKARIPAWYNG